MNIETKNKIRDKAKQRWANPEFKNMMRNKIQFAILKCWENPTSKMLLHTEKMTKRIC